MGQASLDTKVLMERISAIEKELELLKRDVIRFGVDRFPHISSAASLRTCKNFPKEVSRSLRELLPLRRHRGKEARQSSGANLSKKGGLRYDEQG